MARRTLLFSIVLVSLVFLIGGLQHQQQRRNSNSSRTRQRRATRKPAKPPITSFVSDPGGRELIVRVLDVGQGDATYIRNGASRIIIDGGPEPIVFGRYLDSLSLNNTTIDVVILSHQH